jgi:hypothetical protein
MVVKCALYPKDDITILSRSEMMQGINKKYDLNWIRSTEDFYGHSKGIQGIWLGSASKVADYFAVGDRYEIGVLKSFEKYINKCGWYSEWYDCGTLMLYPL